MEVALDFGDEGHLGNFEWEQDNLQPDDSIMNQGSAAPRPAPVASPPQPSAQAGSGSDTKARRITVWNRKTKRKVSGNAAPMEKNLAEYLKKHPECEMYDGQDKHLTVEEKAQLIAEQNRIPIWNKAEGRKISGNAAPSEKNLSDYLAKHPNCEVYAGQDKQPGGWTKPVSKTSTAAAANAQSGQLAQSSALPIQNSDPFADPFADLYKHTENEAGLFSMSGLADSLPMEDEAFPVRAPDLAQMGMSLEDGMSTSFNNRIFSAARNSFDDQRFMGSQPVPTTKSPDHESGGHIDGYSMSPAQRIKLDMISRGRSPGEAGSPPRGGMGSAMLAGSQHSDMLGMSFSLQDEDLLLMDEETLAGGVAADL